MLAVGDIAPATDIAVNTERCSLTPHDGKKMVIFFFPRADTSGCTKESIQFSNLIEDFAAAGKVVAVWPKVNINGHAAEVLAFVQTM
tara:strand:+ start:52 stop:312 length:261 start_codon:yes stop_codon:yes gene_type:complete